MLNKKPEDVEVIFSKLVAAYPELTVADKNLPDLLPKKDRKKIQRNKVFADSTNIRLNLDNEDGCIKHYVHLIKLKGTQGDVMCFFKLARIDFEKIERNFRKEKCHSY